MGETLQGWWEITIKIDGIRAFLDPTKKIALSYNGKGLCGLDDILEKIEKPMDVEVYCGSFKETIKILRATKNTPRQIELKEIYSLEPLDSRLWYYKTENPSPIKIKRYLKEVVDMGYEGLVLRQKNKWLKVKKHETYDVPILGLQEGTGKYVGMLGAFKTPMGNVGTGFTDAERKEYYNKKMLGQTIEVQCMEVTSDNKFRHPRFVRTRFDKTIKV